MDLTILMKLDNAAMLHEDSPNGLAVADVLRSFADSLEFIRIMPPMVIPIRDQNGNLIGAATFM